MVLDSRIKLVREHFEITILDQWRGITPREVLSLDNIGPATLNHIRLYLAGRDIALKNDGTPEFWKKHIGEVKIGGKMIDAETKTVSPFRIVVDTNETYPYLFQDIKDEDNNVMIVQTADRRLPEDCGDYQVDGMPTVTVERKSLEDLYRTLADREEFKKQMNVMNTFMRVAFVVIEATYFEICEPAKYEPDWRSQLSPRSVWHTINSWRTRFPRVHWIAAGNRRWGELMTYDLLYRAWKNL